VMMPAAVAGATLFWVREGGVSSGPGAVMQTPR